jgi:putative intracellular protease/amidase
MRFVIFIPPKDFKDETLSALKLVFDRWGVRYSVASYTSNECMGYHGAVCRPDMSAHKIDVNDFDGIVLVDGPGIEEMRLYEYRPLLDVLLIFNQKGKYVGGISNAIKIIARANIVKDKKVVLPRDEEGRRLVLLFHGVPSEKSLELSSNIFTIRDSVGLEGPLQELLQQFGAI